MDQCIYINSKKGPTLVKFDPASLVVKAPEKKQGNSRMISLFYRYEGKEQPLRFQFPRMRCPFDLKFAEYNGQVKKYKRFALSFEKEENDPRMQNIRKTIRMMEHTLLNVLQLNSAKWFPSRNGKEKSREYIQEIYNGAYDSIIRQQESYPDLIDFKVYVSDGVMSTKFFDEDAHNIVDTEAMDVRNHELTVIGSLEDIWIVGGTIYPKFVALQVQVFDSNDIDDFGFVDDSRGVEESKKEFVEEFQMVE